MADHLKALEKARKFFGEKQMNEFSDSQMVMQNALQEDPVQKKMAMDALRKRIAGEPDKEKQLREACQGFEAIFIQKIWEQMRKNVPKEGYLHSKDEETYQSMFDQELAKKMSSAGGIGLADMMYEQLSQKLGESSRTTTPGRFAAGQEIGALNRPVPVASLDERPEVSALPERPFASDAVQTGVANAPAKEGREEFYQPFVYPDDNAAPDAAQGAQEAAPGQPAAAFVAQVGLERVPDEREEVARVFDTLEQSVRAQGVPAMEPASPATPANQTEASEQASDGSTLAATEDAAQTGASAAQAAVGAASAVPQATTLSTLLTSGPAPVPAASTGAPETILPQTPAAPVSDGEPQDAAEVTEADRQSRLAAQSVARARSRLDALRAQADAPVVAPRDLAAAADEGASIGTAPLNEPIAVYNQPMAAALFGASATATPAASVHASVPVSARFPGMREFRGPTLEEQRALAAIALAQKLRTRS